MKNPANRDMMAALYRLVEKYETLPEDKVSTDPDRIVEHFKPIIEDCEKFLLAYPNSAFALEFISALYGAVSMIYKEAQEKLLEKMQKNA